MSTQHRIKELDDWDRTPEGVKYLRLMADWRERVRPMGVSQRIPSPYTEAQKVVKRETNGAMVAFCCFAAMGAMLTVIGGVQVVR